MLIRKILKRKTSRNGKFRYDIICGCLVIKMLSSINRLFQYFRIATIPRTGAGKHGGERGDGTGSSTTGRW